jgi:hypothetical protein
MKALIAGWFSFEEMGATAGDFLCLEVACKWLRQAGFSYDIAYAAPFTGGVDWRNVDPTAYSHAVFVCGPFGNGSPVTEFLKRFSGCRLVGLSLTMLESLDAWNPFDLLWERDSSRATRPDLSFISDPSRIPVVGLIQIDSQPEYGERNLMGEANAALERILESREASVVRIDTRLDQNRTGQRTAGEVEALVARMDVVVTTRMHGMVLALKNGVPALVIDPVAGGAKIKRQADTIGWPVVFTADDLDDGRLRSALDYCLSPEASTKAINCRERALESVRKVRDEFIRALREVGTREGV